MAERALVVDDEEDLRYLLRFELEAEGYDVVEAAGGSEALEVLDRQEVDLVLLDLSMPGLDGFAVLEEMRRRGLLPGVRVIAVSAHASEPTVQRALDLGSAGYLYKPFRSSELWDAIRAGS